MGKLEDLYKVIKTLIEVLSDVLEEKPDLPGFIINILNESPEVLLFLPGGQEDNLLSCRLFFPNSIQNRAGH